jgi:ABC-type Na+ transport system ATPase subunit NatA
VREVSFLARDGRITGLLGPNGAGKSTTLRMLCTVLQPDAGEALIDGHVVAREPIAARRLIGVLSHASGLYPHLTGAENIAYFGELHGLSRAESRRRGPWCMRRATSCSTSRPTASTSWRCAACARCSTSCETPDSASCSRAT